MSGNGTIEYPWDLETGLNALTTIQCGHELLFKAGTYMGDYSTRLAGCPSNTITVKPITSAKIDGSIVLHGNYVIFRDLEICYSGWSTRQSAQDGSQPTDIVQPDIKGDGTNLLLVNCHIHDLALVFFSLMANMELYGCHIHSIGWLGTDRGHGHGLYLQNNTPTMRVRHCIIHDNFGWNIHAYSGNVDKPIQNFIFDGNILFSAGSLAGQARSNILLGGNVLASGSEIINNATYNGRQDYDIDVGYVVLTPGATNIVLRNNYCPNGIHRNAEFSIDSGNYEGPGIGNTSKIFANEYDESRANMAIYNQDAANTIAVDVSSVFNVGDSINARNVQDYFTDIQNLTVASNGTITVDMQAANRSVAAPVGWTAPTTTFPDFGCFVLERQ